jgi:protein TonB
MHGQPHTGRLNFRQLIRLCLVVSLSVAASSTTSTVHAQRKPAPVTMGSLVMMRVNSVSGAQEAIGAALSHPEPGMRIVAARLVAVGRLTALRLQLSAALRSEKNEAVAAEQARAYSMLGGTHPTEELDAYLAIGAPPTVAVAYGLELARHQPQPFLDRLPRLITVLGPDRAADLAPAVKLLGVQHPAHADAAFRSWLTHAPAKAWSSVLSRQRTGPGESVIAEAASSDDVTVREATVWFVATWVSRGLSVPTAVLEAMGDRQDASAWEAFGRELVARKLHNTSRNDRSALVAAQPAARRQDLQAIDGSDLLLPAEQLAIDTVLGALAARSGVSVPPSNDLPLMRTPENLWPGFFGSLAEATGCRPSGWNFGAVRVTYTADGRPMALTIDRGDLSESCAEFATALGHVTLIEPATPIASGAMQWLIVTAARGFLSCADAPQPRLGLPKVPADPDANGRIEEPKKTHNVAPRYPRDAQMRGVSGVVVLEAFISDTGCVRSVSTERSIDPYLDMEATRAVIQWRYTPTRLNGDPVDTLMTVTVNFTLN